MSEQLDGLGGTRVVVVQGGTGVILQQPELATF